MFIARQSNLDPTRHCSQFKYDKRDQQQQQRQRRDPFIHRPVRLQSQPRQTLEPAQRRPAPHNQLQQDEGVVRGAKHPDGPVRLGAHVLHQAVQLARELLVVPRPNRARQGRVSPLVGHKRVFFGARERDMRQSALHIATLGGPRLPLSNQPRRVQLLLREQRVKVRDARRAHSSSFVRIRWPDDHFVVSGAEKMQQTAALLV